MSDEIKVAAVTGAARGIGRAISERLGNDGYRVVLLDRDSAAVEQTAKDLVDAGMHAHAVAVDVRDKEMFASAVDEGLTALGGSLHAFVNNAGYTELADPLELTQDQWDAMIAVNARGALFGLQIASERLGRGGSIVSMSSATARGAYVPSPHYAASKAAVGSLTMTFAAYLAPRGIRVNSVAPAIVDTDLWDGFDLQVTSRDGAAPGTAKRDRISQIPIGRAGTPRDVASAVSFLISPENGFITGECIDLTGGSFMR